MPTSFVIFSFCARSESAFPLGLQASRVARAFAALKRLREEVSADHCVYRVQCRCSRAMSQVGWFYVRRWTKKLIISSCGRALQERWIASGASGFNLQDRKGLWCTARIGFFNTMKGGVRFVCMIPGNTRLYYDIWWKTLKSCIPCTEASTV